MKDKCGCPLAFINANRFFAKPLLLGEAPSPIDPVQAWSKRARATQKLATLIFGSRSDENLNALQSVFHCYNLLSEYPGKKYPSELAKNNLKVLQEAGTLKGRVTFYFGRNVYNSLLAVEGSNGADTVGKYRPDLGCIRWFGCQEIGKIATLSICAPHPQTFYRFIPEPDLNRLSVLLRASIAEAI